MKEKSIVKSLCFLVVLLVLLLYPHLLSGQATDQVRLQLFRGVNQLVETCQNEQVLLFAPKSYGKAYEYYLKAVERYNKGDKLKSIQEDLDQALRYLKTALETGRVSRLALEKTNLMRSQILELNLSSFAEAEFREAEDAFKELIRKAEEGDLKSVRSDMPDVDKKYRQVVIAAYQKSILKSAEKNLDSRKRAIGSTAYQKARVNLDQVKRELDDADKQPFVVADFAGKIRDKIGVSLDALYPEFYRHLPDTLQLGQFTLYVLSYSDRGHYDFANNMAVGLTGEAEIAFHCGLLELMPIPWGEIITIQKGFRVVNSVLNPDAEISIAEARRIDAKAHLNQEMVLPLRAVSSSRADLLKAKVDFLDHVVPSSSASRGRIRVRFQNASIIPTPRNTFGTITVGQAYYPTSPADPAKPALVPMVGFTMMLDSLLLTPANANAWAKLALPSTLVDDAGCGPAVLNLGAITLTSGCQFYKELADSTFGPFIMDPTAMVFQGKGYIADFSSTQSPSGLSLSPDWKGVILKSGSTIPEPSASVVSNTGYLKAGYQFSNARVTTGGLASRFTTPASYTFAPLQPLDYSVTLGAGFVDIDSSSVQSGSFGSGTINLPSMAAWKGMMASPIAASFSGMAVQKDLDLTAQVALNDKLYWGELTRSGGEVISYAARPGTAVPGPAYFYLSAKPTSLYVPNASSDFTIFWGADPLVRLEEKQITGVTVIALQEFEIFTQDIPGSPPKSILFKESAETSLTSSWLNISLAGVNGRVVIHPGAKNVELGDTKVTYYRGPDSLKVPFKAKLECRGQKKEKCFFVQFSSSAVFDSEFSGILDIGGPSNIDIPFVDLEVTSTAHLVGGDIDLSGGPVTLEYWGVQLVSTSSSAPAGALSVKTGQIIFTQAGIREKRHFAAPFKLQWGEMFASGNIGQLFFDYNAAGQKFDGFSFTPAVIALSTYEVSKPGYLQVCGDNHFNFFGSYYLSIQDSVYTRSDPLGVYGGRSIGLMTSAVNGCRPSNLHVIKNWSSSIANFDFITHYDSNDQDGFVGEGSSSLPGHFQNMLSSSVQMDSTQIQASLAIGSSTNFMLAASEMGVASDLWGCINITANTVGCITLGFTMEASTQSTFGLLGGAGSMVEVKMVIKPTFTSFSAAGKMYVDLSLGGLATMDGSILLTADYSANSVYGDLQGKFDFTSLFSGLKAEGHVNWLLSPATQYLQGRASIQVFSRTFGGGASGGIFLGNNVAKGDAWVLLDPSNRYSVAVSQLPEFISGVYGYGSINLSLNFGIFSGGIGIYAGVGAFMNLPGLGNHQPSLALPYVLANIGVSLSGEILWGLVSASAWVNLQFCLGDPLYFQGTAGLEGCVLWVLCASVDVTVRLSDSNGFEIY